MVTPIVRRTAFIFLMATLSGCSTGPGDTRSFRASVADAIAPPGYTPQPAAPMVMAPAAPPIQGSYQSDIARQQGGLPAVSVSQVSVYGGRARVPTGGAFSMSTDWRNLGGVTTVTVAECESTPIVLQRADKIAAGTTIYATRLNGIVYVSPYASANCQIPPQSQSYPSYGRYPLELYDRVAGATIRIDAWGGVPAPVGSPYSAQPY